MTRETEIDGVPTLIAPMAGPMHAGLIFRVGRADETLARGGITHLVEHLALFGHGLTDYHYNGTTGVTVTHFHMHGSEGDVVAFLTGVCRSLGELPVDRLETEKSILRTEAAGKGRGAADAMPLWRHGAQGYGLSSYPEWGLSEFTADDVREWSARYFTRDNAVLWIAGGDVPAGLRLPLPAGRRQPMPTLTSALPVTPAYFVGSPNGVVFDALVTRRTAASVFAGVLDRELFRTLRQDGGYSYTATASYDPLSGDTAAITAMADALPEKQGAVLGGFIDVLAKLKVGRIEHRDIEAFKAKSEEAFGHPEAVAGMLPGRAFNLITGYPHRTIEELREELHAVTTEDVHAVAVEAMGSALLSVPEYHSADWAGFAEAPTHSAAAVEGTSFRSLEDDEVRVVVGPAGTSLVTPSGPVTVRADECAALLAWPDGARQLVGSDGMVVRIEPTLFAMKPGELAPIDAAVAPSVVVPMPRRDPDAIPKPTPASERRKGKGKPPQSRTRRLLKFLLFSVLALAGLFAVTAVIVAAGADVEGATRFMLRSACIGLFVGGFFAWRASKKE
jgi:hypothetical protein